MTNHNSKLSFYQNQYNESNDKINKLNRLIKNEKNRIKRNQLIDKRYKLVNTAVSYYILIEEELGRL
jgi:hypothetical protein